MNQMFVDSILFFTLVTGVAVLYMGEIKGLMYAAGQRINGFLNGFKTETMSLPEEFHGAGLNESIRRMLQITFDMGSRRALVVFWVVSTALPVMLFILMHGKISNALIISASIFMSALPVILLLGRLQTLRIGSSKEGRTLLTELLDNYKIHYFNMHRAVEITAATIEEAPNCRRLLFNLSKGLNRAAGADEIKTLLDDFKFAIGTSWASVLSDNMYFALTSGIRVDAAMEDLIKTVVKAEEVAEHTDRENNEAGLILKYLAPVCYLLTVIGGIKYFGLTPREFFDYQFGTAAGLGWFTAAVLTYVVSIIAKGFLSRSKLDL